MTIILIALILIGLLPSTAVYLRNRDIRAYWRGFDAALSSLRVESCTSTSANERK